MTVSSRAIEYVLSDRDNLSTMTYNDLISVLTELQSARKVIGMGEEVFRGHVSFEEFEGALDAHIIKFPEGE